MDKVCSNYQANDYAISTYGSELAGDCLNCTNCGRGFNEHSWYSDKWIKSHSPQPDGDSTDLSDPVFSSDDGKCNCSCHFIYPTCGGTCCGGGD